jgi:predicted NBD/HSP70 family sugar kinase
MNNGVPAEVVRFETPHDTEAFLEQLYKEIAKQEDITTIAIGVPGLVDDDGMLIRCANLPCNIFPLKNILADK